MLTKNRREDLDKMKVGQDFVRKYREEGNSRDSLYPMALGAMGYQCERVIAIAREALDEVDRLKAQLEAAEAVHDASEAAAEYWDKFYGDPDDEVDPPTYADGVMS